MIMTTVVKNMFDEDPEKLVWYYKSLAFKKKYYL